MLLNLTDLSEFPSFQVVNWDNVYRLLRKQAALLDQTGDGKLDVSACPRS